MHYHHVVRHVQFEMIVEDGFCCLNKRMIVNDSSSVSSFAKNGLEPKWQEIK